jgi:hypothetical protein
MQFEKLLNELKKLNLPPDEFAITSSGCLAVRGIREANDLDLVVSDKLFDDLSKRKNIIKEFNTTLCPKNGYLTLF